MASNRVSVIPPVVAQDANAMRAMFADMGGSKVRSENERDKIALTEIGHYVIARLMGARQCGKKKSKPFMAYDLEGINNQKWFLLGSFDLDNTLHERHVGRVLAIGLVDLLDTGEDSPMKSYEVRDYGTEWPEACKANPARTVNAEITSGDDVIAAEDAADDDMPF